MEWMVFEKRWLNSPGEEQDDKDDDDERGTTAEIVIAGAEPITTTTEKQENEKDKEDGHDVWIVGCETKRERYDLAMGCSPRLSQLLRQDDRD